MTPKQSAQGIQGTLHERFLLVLHDQPDHFYLFSFVIFHHYKQNGKSIVVWPHEIPALLK